MSTIGNLLEKFKVSLELDEKVKNHELTECNINHITDYHTEKHENRTIYVFSGNINNNATEIEYILDFKDNDILWPYLAKHPNQTDKRYAQKPYLMTNYPSIVEFIPKYNYFFLNHQKCD